MYAAPVAQWGGGCGGCGGQVGYGGYGAQVGYGGYGGYGGGYNGGCGNCGVPAVYTTPAPLYVVNQGPAFEGPGLMVPYHSYAPSAEYAPPPAYPPYGGGYGGGYARRIRCRLWRRLCAPAPRLWRRWLLPSAVMGRAITAAGP